MTLELSPENVETIARRVVELLQARERQPGNGTARGRGGGEEREDGDGEDGGADEGDVGADEGNAAGLWSSPPPAHWRLGPLRRRASGSSVPLLPIRGYDENGRWIDIEFDSTGNPIERSGDERFRPSAPTSRASRPV